MTKTSYNNLLKPKKRLSVELQIEYDKLITDMKVFFRDSYLVPETLLSISELDNDTNSNDVEKFFNIIPNVNEDDIWEELNSSKIYNKKNKSYGKYRYGWKEFKNPKRKTGFTTSFFDGKNSYLYSGDNPSLDPGNGELISVYTLHNIKAHAPEPKKDVPTSKDLLSKYLSKKELPFYQPRYSQGKKIDDKIYNIKYPVLHPKVITYISLIKRALSIFLKSNDINFSSIDIFPNRNKNLLLFIASSEAKDLNTFCSENSFIVSNLFEPENSEASPLANAFTIFIDDAFAKSNLFLKLPSEFNASFELSFYTRDKSLRFDTIMNKRMERIIKTIKSLNNLHHKGNYEFDKDDFDKSYQKLSMAIQHYRTIYEQWFKDNAVPKSAEEEIEMLRKELAEKEALLKKSKK